MGAGRSAIPKSRKEHSAKDQKGAQCQRAGRSTVPEGRKEHSAEEQQRARELGNREEQGECEQKWVKSREEQDACEQGGARC